MVEEMVREQGENSGHEWGQKENEGKSRHWLNPSQYKVVIYPG